MRKFLAMTCMVLPLILSSQTASAEKPVIRLAGLTEPARLVRETPLIRDGRAVAFVFHPDSENGRKAAAAIVAAVKAQTGVRLTTRPGTAADAAPDRTVILIGNVNTNPALTLLYSRFFTPVDDICPGKGGSMIHTVFDPFGKKCNAVVVGASDALGGL